MKKKFHILIIMLILPIISFGQDKDCFYYHEFECKYPDDSYFYSGQSRGALFAYGMTSQLKIVTFGGEDYHISICHRFKTKNVRMRLLEDDDNKTVIYDNAEFKYQTEMSFSNNVARKLIIEIFVPESPTPKEKNEMNCVGVLIHFKKTYKESLNKVGF